MGSCMKATHSTLASLMTTMMNCALATSRTAPHSKIENMTNCAVAVVVAAASAFVAIGVAFVAIEVASVVIVVRMPPYVLH